MAETRRLPTAQAAMEPPKTLQVQKSMLSQKSMQEPESHLFAEINALRAGKVEEKDQDAIDRAKLNNTIFGKLAGSKKFEYTTLAIIVFNAGFIGYDADFSARNEKPDNLYACTVTLESGEERAFNDCYQFIIFENLFAVYFTFEVVVRFWSYRRKRDMCTDMWFIFDSVLVTFMVLETWVLPVVGASGPLSQLSVLRLLRLLRITRMAKLMRFFPELQIIVKGMLAAVRSVVCTAILLILILYVWSILFTSEFHQGITEDSDLEENSPTFLFGSMGKSMRHLFIMGTILDDITLCCNTIRGSTKGASMLIFFILFVLISSFTMLNMLIGILCEVVCATGEGERRKGTEAHVREAISELFDSMDNNHDGLVTREEFLSMRRNTNVMKALQELEVEAKHFDMYADLMFKPEEEGGEVPTFNQDKILNMIMRLRPGTKVSALDFASFQTTVHKNHDSLKKHITNIEKMASVLTGEELAQAEELAGVLGNLPVGKTSAGVLPQLQTMSDADILNELQYRIGSFSVDGQRLIQTGVDPNIQRFPDIAWSKELYSC